MFYRLQRRGSCTLLHSPTSVSPRLRASLRASPWKPPWQGPDGAGCEQMLANLCVAGNLDGALDILTELRAACLPSTYISLLRACSKSKVLWHAMCVHAHLSFHGSRVQGPLGEHLVMALANCGALDDACRVSALLPARSDTSWSALISAYAERGCLPKALELYRSMQDDGAEPNRYTFVNLIKACGRSADLKQGKILHVEARAKGMASDPHVTSALLTMYEQCGAAVEAECTFCASPHRDVVTWNTMLSVCVKQCQPEKALHLYRQMQEEGLYASHLTFVIAFQACGRLTEKRKEVMLANRNKSASKVGFEILQGLHADAQRMLFELDTLSGNTLVTAYGKCGEIGYAYGVFSSLRNRETVAWNALLTAYVADGLACDSLQLYKQMHLDGTTPDKLTFVQAFQACSILLEDSTLGMEKCLHIVQALHTDACSTCRGLDGLVSTPIMELYAKLGKMADAESVFGSMPCQDVVAWTAMLAAYAEQDQAEKALQVYAQMQKQGPGPNPLTYVCALGACGMLAESKCTSAKVIALIIGHVLHADACLRGFTSYVFVATALACMYARCGVLLEAENVFNAMPQRDTAAWNAMLYSLVVLGEVENALLLFQALAREGAIFDDGTIVSLTHASVRASNMEITRQLHFVVLFGKFEIFSSVSGSLIDAYGSFGSMADADACFHALTEPDIEGFTAWIHGHAAQGNAIKSMAVFEGMKTTSEKVDEIAVTSALTGLTHAGLVTDCINFFYAMVEDSSIKINTKHFASLVDLFGRAGDFERVHSIMAALPMEELVAVLNSVLGACHTFGNVELANFAFDHPVKPSLQEESTYVQLSNASPILTPVHNKHVS